MFNFKNKYNIYIITQHNICDKWIYNYDLLI